MMKCFWYFCALLLFLTGCQQSPLPQVTTSTEVETPGLKLATGTWRAVLESPGGELPFRIEIVEGTNGYLATAHNGEESLRFDSLKVQNTGQFSMAIEHYDSVFEGNVLQGGKRLEGQWRKRVDQTRVAELGFSAQFGESHRFETQAEPKSDFSGIWEVVFSKGTEDEGPAVAHFSQNGTQLTGTFLTPTGDYRYLEGNVSGNQLFLSCFDGGHAFLFKATMDDQGKVSGDFWSSDKWHEPWTAQRNSEAKLEDAMGLTDLKDGISTFRFNFPDLEGVLVSQEDPRFSEKVLVISIFGSWCPNCNDEAPFLQELYVTYKDQGLEVIGLAFEATGDPTRDTQMLKRFKKRHGIDYHLLLAGQKDKASAGAKLPDINHVLAYPTTLFVRRDGTVAHIHTGFTGPGTGREFIELKAKYHQMIKALL